MSVLTSSTARTIVRISKITAATVFSGHVFEKIAYFRAALLNAAIGKLTAHHDGENDTEGLNIFSDRTINKNSPK
jgi:hypothetical protein